MIQLRHIGVYVHDLEKMSSFYKKVYVCSQYVKILNKKML